MERMIAKIHSIVPFGFEGKLVEVEGDMNRGLPAFNIVGMANKTINEAKERVRSAICNSGFCFPDKKVTINLAPAELQKDGAYLDLPIALAILTLSGQLIKNDTALSFFKGFITAVEKSNPGYHWDWDEKKLIGKNVIAVFGDEEYEDKNGNIKIGTKLVEFRSLEAYKEGKITVPPLKKLERPEPKVSESANLEQLQMLDDDFPF